RRVDQHVPINSNNDKRRNEREKDRTCEKECKEAGEKEGEEALNSLLHSGTDRQKLRFWLDGLKGGRHGKYRGRWRFQRSLRGQHETGDEGQWSPQRPPGAGVGGTAVQVTMTHRRTHGSRSPSGNQKAAGRLNFLIRWRPCCATPEG